MLGSSLRHLAWCLIWAAAATTAGAEEQRIYLDQMTEAVHVASAIRGGAALVHGVQMRKRDASLSM